jgi:hypothetical protein
MLEEKRRRKEGGKKERKEREYILDCLEKQM